MRANRRAWATMGALVLALAATACSEDASDQEPAAAQSSTTVPSGAPSSAPPPAPNRVVDLATEGFSIEVPAGWKDIVIDVEALQRLIAEGETDEAIANQVRTLAGRGGKLFAYDDSRRTTNLNVLKLSATPGATLQSIAEALPAQLGESGLRDVQVETVTIAAGEAVRAVGSQEVTGAGGNKATLLQLQYWVLDGNQMFISVFATDDPARDRTTLEAIAQSFKLL